MGDFDTNPQDPQSGGGASAPVPPHGNDRGPMGGGGLATAQGPSAAPSPAPGQFEPSQLELIRRLSQGRTGGTSLPGPVPQKDGQRVQLQGIMGLVQMAVKNHKEKQVRSAMSDWMGLQAAHERAEMAAGDPSSMPPDQYQKKVSELFQKDPIAQSVVSDPKKMKNMAKSFQQDWLNPDKTTVYGEALKRAMQADKAGKMVKMMRTLKMKSQPKPQMNAGQQQQFGQEMGSRVEAMARPTGVEPSVQREALVAEGRLADKYEIKESTDPTSHKTTFWAVDRSHPNAPAIPVKTSQGDDLTGKASGAAGRASGKVLTIEGKPYGVTTAAGTVATPGAKDFDEAAAHNYDEANKAWSIAESQKQKLAGIRAATYIDSREYGVIDKLTGNLTMASARAINQNQGRYAPAGGGLTAMSREAMFQDIQYNIDNVNTAIDGINKGHLSNKQRLQMLAAMRSTDPHTAVQTFISTSLAPSDAPLADYLISITAMQENAMALRGLQGAGGASDMLRRAIEAMVPGPGTKLEIARKQMKVVTGIVDRLKKGVPTVIETPTVQAGSVPQAD